MRFSDPHPTDEKDKRICLAIGKAVTEYLETKLVGISLWEMMALRETDNETFSGLRKMLATIDLSILASQSQSSLPSSVTIVADVVAGSVVRRWCWFDSLCRSCCG
jgi:hypothetical protein